METTTKIAEIEQRPVTASEIEAHLESLIKKSKEEVEEIESLASKYDQYVKVDHSRKVQLQISVLYPELDFDQRSGINLFKLDELSNKIERAVRLVYPNALRLVHVDSYNEKNGTIKFSSINYYDLEKVLRFFGINEEHFKGDYVKKSYQNGSYVIEPPKETFDKFIELIMFKTPATDKVINAITVEDRLECLERVKSKHMNVYPYIHEIIERAGVKPYQEPVNFFAIAQAIMIS